MVLAEIPLWVVHPSSSSQDAGPLFGGAAASHRTNAERAQHSLRLLQGRQKCAIYSVDLHPPLMATAGGDGTVRLWNSQALFAHDDDDDEKGGGGGSSVAQYSEQGTYVSSSASSSSEGEENNNNNNMHHKDTNGGFSSSDSGAENDEQVHDLNAVVRRKKDGSSPQRKQQQQQSRAAAAAAAGEAPLSPSRARGGTSGSSSKHHHHHHHRLICTLSAHTGSSVLCVRFSPSGKYLASAGDDAVVCIYTATAAAAAATGPNGNRTAGDQQQQQQHWSRIKLCRGHGLDVVDLAWAPDDSHLVSCSLDSETPIIVWKLTDLVSTAAAAAAGGVATTTTTLYSSKSILCNPYKILGRDIHTSTVKGVAFDPAGSYLASSGDDPAVCIWRAHDDWGLEKRIDASSGIFRKWRGSSGSTGTTNTTSTKVDSHDVDDVQALSNQSMFRRLSWSTDGAFLCATNAVVKNKHVASTIGREGWSVATNSAEGAVGAATLVGHKQPVVVSRHAAELLNGKKKKKKKKPDGDSDGNEMEVDDNDDDDDDDDSEPESATLLALGDHRGFITVWSTRKSRPLFKLQCSESRCTVTDLAWGRMLDKTTGEKGDMLLLVSLLDGQLVALKFSVPDELGPFLTPKDHRRVFQLRYGIDVEDDGRQLVGRNTGGTRLIENAVQLSLEEANDDKDDEGHFASGGGDDDDDYDAENPFGEDGAVVPAKELTPRSVRDQQEESRLQGKKRVRPVLMSVSAAPDKRPREQEAVQLSKESTQLDPMQAALKAAEKASAAIETAPSGSQSQATTSGKLSGGSPPADTTEGHRSKQHEKVHEVSLSVTATSKIPHDNSRVRSVDLPMPADHIHDPLEPEQVFYVAECANTIKVPTGSQGASIPCIDLVLKENSRVTWRDQIPGATCSALAASRSILAVGTSDGSLQLYGNSPTLGWKSGLSFRSHPPLVFGSCVVRLRLDYRQNEENEILELLVVTADGGFGVYTILPRLTLQYKGSLLPAMTHMALGASISDQSTNERNSARSSKKVGVGGSLQAFVYDRHSELWMRISDSRFVLSDFYSSLPSSRMTMSLGPLSQMDDSVKMGSLKSLLHSSHRNRSYETEAIYNQAEEPTGNYIASRSHCEDRMACAVALESSSEFKYWLVRYVRNLAVMGNASQLRMVVDMLLDSTNQSLLDSESSCWWLSSSPDLLQLERKGLVRDIVIKEMSKNRALQRLTNEISLELQSI